MRIVLIGAGHVATVLGRKFLSAGHTIVAVCSKTRPHADQLAKELNAQSSYSIDELSRDADLYLFAISDDQLRLAPDWNFRTDKLVAHTAGSVSRYVLQQLSSEYGVLYPLQTLRKELPVFAGIPLLIEGSTPAARQQLLGLAQTISDNVREADDEQRRRFHLAAVIVNNFSNHLYVLTQQYCGRENIDFQLLLPLISEGVERLREHPASALQTGPASRGDLQTIEAHRELLQEHPSLLLLYKLFTASIIATKDPPVGRI